MRTTFEQAFQHISVLRQSVSEFLNLKSGDTAIDATLGLGGHCEDMLSAVSPKGHVYAFDQDLSHIEFAKNRLKKFEKSLTIFHSNFSEMEAQLYQHGIRQVQGILFDLGLASPHVDQAQRGFSFLKEGLLDMRFDATSDDLTAADLLNRSSEKDLEHIFRVYGEERYSRRIAAAIIQYRELQPFSTTTQLAALVQDCYPARERKGRIHPATRVFQALRIAVNRELEVLEEVLPQAFSLLAPHGRLVVISYHSLEDRIVKHFLKSQAAECICPPEVLRCECRGRPLVKILTKKPVEASDEEISANSRSRSAKLRAAEKL